ncbi:SRPBCC family protein [Georgenia wangjunii]|uniref:SRPBCC family protein n=1 Tax=Georgenia wangjunii TaxID=3117730 RepID=UPI002F262C89
MAPTPVGRLVRTDRGRDLVLVRHLPVPVDEAWAALTRPEVAGRWFATWADEARPGATIRATLTGEDDAEVDMTINACEPPRHLAVSSVDEHGSWHLDVTLADESSGTHLTFVHHLDDDAAVGEIGPGWEYYLDSLAAVLLDTPGPDFADYFPAQKPYYEGL